jgi:hypothetical protein
VAAISPTEERRQRGGRGFSSVAREVLEKDETVIFFFFDRPIYLMGA